MVWILNKVDTTNRCEALKEIMSLNLDSHPLDGWFGLAKDCDITIIEKGVRHSDFKQKRP